MILPFSNSSLSLALKLSLQPDCQAFPAVFVQDVERTERLSVIGSVMYEVVAPDVVAIFRAQPDAGAVVQSQPPLPRLFRWYFKPLALPQSFYTLVVHVPSRISQKCRDPAITVATVLSCQLYHARSDRPLTHGKPKRLTATAFNGAQWFNSPQVTGGEMSLWREIESVAVKGRRVQTARGAVHRR